MRRGAVRTVSGGRDRAGKPRPVVVVQDDRFDATDSIMIRAVTTVPKSTMGERVGRLDDGDAVRLNRAVMVLLGLAVSPRRGRKGNDGRARRHGR